MLNSIKSFITKVGVKLGLIKALERVTEHKKVSMPSEFYQKIMEWRALHRGTLDSMHQVNEHTIADGMKKRTIASMNMPKVVTQELASLIYNERCSVSVSDENFNEFIQDVFKQNKFNGQFQQYLEFMFAMGGMVIKPYIEDGKIVFGYATADCAIPVSWQGDTISEMVFPSAIKHQGKSYTLLEWHLFEEGKYVIRNELYESLVSGDLGAKVPLSTIFPDLEPVVYVNKVERPLFTYFKPNIANNIDPTLPLGISIYANAYDTLKSIDIAFDSLQREFRHGRSRIIVPESAIKTVVDPQTGTIKRYFDSTDETYEAMNTGNMDDNKITVVTTTLRVQEHVDGINALLNILAMQLGFSAGTFSFDASGGLKTATEVVAEQSKTFRTKQSHENVIEQGITDLIEVVAVLAKAANLYNAPKDYEVTVAFDDSIAQDKNAEADYLIKLVASQLESKVDAIMKLHGLSEEEAIQKLQKIIAEEKSQAPDFNEIQKEVSMFSKRE